MAFIVVNPFTTKSKNTTARLCKAPSVGYTSKRYHPRMGIRAVESYDGSFTLTEEVRNALDGMLLSARLSDYVANQARRESAEYMGILFQPLPYSKATPHGMPQEMEQYRENPNFAIINIPPRIMFNAKAFKPPRLCAVYRLQGIELQGIPTEVDDSEWQNVGEAFRNPVTEDGEDLDKYMV